MKNNYLIFIFFFFLINFNPKTVLSNEFIFESNEIEINDNKHLNILIDKVNAKKFVSNCSRQINEG